MGAAALAAARSAFLAATVSRIHASMRALSSGCEAKEG